MDFSKQTNDQLNALCKQNGIKGYSKLKKDDKIALLVESNVKVASTSSVKKVTKATKKTEEKEVKEKKATKPRVEKLDKKLAKSIDLDKYKDVLSEQKEEWTVSDISNLLKSDIELFVQAADNREIAELVDKFGALIAITYQRTHKNSKLSAKEDEEIYKILLLHLFLTNEKALDALVKAVRKFHAKLLKPVVEKKTKKVGAAKKVTKVDEPNEDEEEDDEVEEDAEEAVSKEIEEPDYNDSEEDDL